MVFRLKCHLIAGVIFPLSFYALPSYANYPDVVGTFSANGISTEVESGSGPFFGCGISSPTPASGTTAATLNITSQTDSSISGDITITTPSPQTVSIAVSGTIDTNGNLSVSGSMGTQLYQVFLDGVFDGNQLSVAATAFQYAPASNQRCHRNSSAFTFSFGGDTLDPETAAGTQLIINNNLRSDVNSIGNPIQSHLTKTMRGDAKGGNLNESGFLIEGEGGLNSGDVQWGNIGIWLSYNFTTTENDFTRTAFETDRHTVVGGFDYSPNDIAVIGLAFAYEDSETDTSFNSGKVDSDGFTVAPYLGILFSETWSMDATLGLSFIENDQFRIDPSSSNRVTSNPDTDRFFFSGNFNGVTYHNNWIFGGRIGYLYARSSTEAFIESNATAIGKNATTLGQLRLGGDAAYSWGNWEPFVSALYQYDFSFEEIELTTGTQPDNDRDDILFGTGFRYYSNSGVTGSFEYNKRLFRNQFDEDSVSATLRWDF